MSLGPVKVPDVYRAGRRGPLYVVGEDLLKQPRRKSPHIPLPNPVQLGWPRAQTLIS